VLRSLFASRNVVVVGNEVDQTSGDLRTVRHTGIVAATVGTALTTLLYAMAGEQAQVLSLGIQISVLFGWLIHERKNGSCAPGGATLPLQDTHSDANSGRMTNIATMLTNLRAAVESPDGLVRDCVLSKIAKLDDEFQGLATGRIVFENTETWRATYEKVLRAPGVTEYHSVAWVKTADYWQDRPGQQSIRLNYDLLDRSVGIERIVILGWNLWLPEIYLPGNSIRRWLEEQHYRGISLSLVRESDLLNEPDLLRDFGIYGTRATGEQELDEQSRTVRFELRFDEPGIRLATDRWERLKLYARPYNELLDQTAIGD
jgi:hypothetical protein